MSTLHDSTTSADAPLQYGAKAAALVELQAAGFAVPAFEVSPRDLFAAMQRLGTPLAVRSCASVEDGATASFAGQFRSVLNVSTLEVLTQAVADCRASGASDTVRAYCQQHGVDVAAVRVDVIVQRMVDAKLAGVAFSVDPVSGTDRVVIEACEGLGEALLAGRRAPLDDSHAALAHWRPAIVKLARDVHRHFGSPQDIEFAIDHERLWLLQARPITRFGFAPDVGEWTNADFRDGGVSASVCSPLMWSLYERAWEQSLIGFLREVHLLGRGERFETGRMFFGRPYWNLGAVKRCLEKLPGYVERRFDEDLSVAPAYIGDGVVTPMTWRGMLRALPTAWALRRFFQQQATFDAAFLGRGFEAIAQRYEQSDSNPFVAFAQLVADDFLLTECHYFRTIFAASLARLDFKDAFPDADEAALVVGLPPLNHFAPIRHMRRMAALRQTNERDIDELLHRFRHHHPAGLDVIHPRWDEQRDFVTHLLSTIVPGTEAAHCDDARDAAQAASSARAAHLARLPRRRRAAFNRKLDRLRTFLYLREQMRDCSSRIYALIRRGALAIAQQRGLGEDVFFMTCDEIIRDDRSHIAERRDAYTRYRRFAAPNEIGSHAAPCERGAPPSRTTWRGLAASRGRVRGTARIVRSAAEAAQLEAGAVLVCPFTDPGWTAVLDRAVAVVTETGGLLSHAAVICRELALPAVLAVPEATRHIPDGATVEVDGDHGEVRLLDATAHMNKG